MTPEEFAASLYPEDTPTSHAMRLIVTEALTKWEESKREVTHLTYPDMHLAKINCDSLVSSGWNASPIAPDASGDGSYSFDIWRD